MSCFCSAVVCGGVCRCLAPIGKVEVVILAAAWNRKSSLGNLARWHGQLRDGTYGEHFRNAPILVAATKDDLRYEEGSFPLSDGLPCAMATASCQSCAAFASTCA